MKAVVPAAGSGTRLRPLTAEKPKPLVTVCGKPILSYCFENLVALDVDEIIVVVGHCGQAIVDYYGNSFADTELTYVWQHERQGLAHALLQAEEYVDDDFLMMDGDNIIIDDLSRSVEYQKSAETDATVFLKEVSAESATSKAVCSVEDGYIQDIVNKPSDPPDPSYVAAGYHTFPPEIFTACSLLRKSSRGEYELSTGIELLIHAGWAVRGVKCEGWSVNINTQADREAAERYIQQNDTRFSPCQE